MFYKKSTHKISLNKQNKEIIKDLLNNDNPVIYGLVPFKSSISQLSVSCWRPPQITCAWGVGSS